jgi:hypothetical protein
VSIRLTCSSVVIAILAGMVANDVVAARPVPQVLRVMVSTEAAVVAWATVLLLLLPARLAEQWWAWSIAPFHARYVGAVYLGAFVPLLLFALRPYVVPGRVVLWMILTFNTTVSVVMLFYRDEFAFDRLHAWAFWTLYLAITVASGYFLYRLRGFRDSGESPTDQARRWLVTVAAVATGGYGALLLAAPGIAAGWWPWPVDAFHSRLYAATFLTAATGTWLLRRVGARLSWLAVGGSWAGFGLGAVAGTLLTGATRSLDLAEAAPFLAVHLLVGLAGVVMLVPWRSSRRTR